MQNTQTQYSSSERMPVVLPEMEKLLPPLSAEQFSVLEADVLENGCYAPIIINEDMVIIDGHNRFRICETHSLPFKMLVFSFEDLLEAKQWALDTQKGRRNLDKWELGKIALKLKPEIEIKARANMSAGGGDQKSEAAKSGLVNSPNPISPVNTRKEMAQAVGIGDRLCQKTTAWSPPDCVKRQQSGPQTVSKDNRLASPKPPFFAPGKKYPALLPELRPYGLKRKTVLIPGLPTTSEFPQL